MDERGEASLICFLPYICEGLDEEKLITNREEKSAIGETRKKREKNKKTLDKRERIRYNKQAPVRADDLGH